MSRLPDRFDLWVRRARDHADPERQVDLVLGALTGLDTWFFFNVGTAEQPQPAEVELDSMVYLLLFSTAERIEEMTETPSGQPAPLIAIPGRDAMEWVLARDGCGGLLVNPGEDSLAIPVGQLRVFHEEWEARGGRAASGFWIPEMTGEEEAFWQENGL